MCKHCSSKRFEGSFLCLRHLKSRARELRKKYRDVKYGKDEYPRRMTIYAVYQGDTLLGVGSAKELNHQLGFNRNQIRVYAQRESHLRHAIRI